MEYHTREEITYSRTFVLKFLVDGVDRFHDTFFWTGKAVNTIQSSNSFHSISISDESGFYTHYDIAFNRLYNRGDKHEFTVKWQLNDSARSAKPFVARQINRVVQKLSFAVKVYAGGHEGEAIAEVAISSADRANSVQSSLRFSESNEVGWTITAPNIKALFGLDVGG